MNGSIVHVLPELVEKYIHDWKVIVVGAAAILVIGLGAGGTVGWYLSPEATGEASAKCEIDPAGPEALDGDKSGGDCYGGVWAEISGAVKTPGVYCAGGDWILDHLIEEAGGLSENVCEMWLERSLNRAALLVANSKVFIPSVADDECSVGQEVVLSADSSDSCPGGGVNINTAGSAELESLSGVGPATAEKMISGRPYSSAEDLLKVSGIGEATLEKFRGEICW